MTAVSSDELIYSLHTRLITSTICSAMRSMISWRGFFHYLLLLQRTFGWDCMFLLCHVRVSEWIHALFGWVLYTSPHIRFCMLSIYIGPLLQVLIKKSNAVFIFSKLFSTLVFGSNWVFLQLDSIFSWNAQ